MESVNLVKSNSEEFGAEIHDFLVNELNSHLENHKNFFEESSETVGGCHQMSLQGPEAMVLNPFLGLNQNREGNNTLHENLIQNEGYLAMNNGQMNNLGYFNFQNFLSDEVNLEGNGGFGKEGQKKKTKGSFKNTYINKINHLMKNIKNKQLSPNQQPLPSKHLLIDLKLHSPENFNEDSINSDEQLLLEGNIDYNSLSELEKINYKLAKNRESARNSRKRKKMYFEMLEAKVIELNDELTAAKKKIKTLEENQDKLSYHSKIVF